MAAPVIENYSTADSGGGTQSSLTISPPSGITAGELLVVIVGSDSDGSADVFSTATSGWSKLGQGGNATSDAYIAVFTKEATGSEGDITVDFTGGSAECWGAFLRISNADTSQLSNFNFAIVSGSSFTISPPDAGGPDHLVLFGISWDGGDGAPFVISGTGYSKTTDITSGTGAFDACGCFGSKVTTATGDPGDISVTPDINDGGAVFTFIITPASGDLTLAADAGSFTLSGQSIQTAVSELPVVDGLVLHLDATAITGLSDFFSVSTWEDLSFKGNDVSSVTHSPVYRTNIQNSLPVVRFDGTLDRVLRNATPDLPSGSSARTFFIVAKSTFAGSANVFFDYGTTTNGQRFGPFDNGTQTGIAYYGGTWGEAVSSSDFMVFMAAFPSGGSQSSDFVLRLNGAALTESTLSGTVQTINTANSDLCVGGGILASQYWSGDIGEIVMFDRELDASEISAMQDYLGTKWGIEVGYAPLTASHATFTLTGQAAAFARSYRLPASHATFTLTGQAATLTRNKIIIATSATFTLTGQATDFNRQYRITCDSGTLTLTGSTTGLFFNTLLTASNGSFTLTGYAAGLAREKRITADPGTFTLSGQSATITVARSLTATSATFTLSGYTVDFDRAEILVVTHGSFTLTGIEATLSRSKIMTAEQGTFTLTGYASALTVTRTISAGVGTFTLSGYAANLLRLKTITADVGSFSLSGQAIDFDRAEIVVADPGTFTLSGQVANFIRAEIITAEHGTFTLTGQDAAFTTNITVPATTATFTLSGQAAQLSVTRTITTDAGSFTLTGRAANIVVQGSVQADSGTFTLTGNDTTITVSRSVTADTATFTLSGYAADFDRAEIMVAFTGSFTLSGQIATLTVTRTLSTTVTTFTITGNQTNFLRGTLFPVEPATFTLTGYSADFDRAEIVAVAAATFTLTGYDTNYAFTRGLRATTATFTLTGQSVRLNYDDGICSTPYTKYPRNRTSPRDVYSKRTSKYSRRSDKYTASDDSYSNLCF